jgi:nitroimidazol reductase NimA-like FMN-containing flavoprotein (pyridoxamine 5'-phosphate oxidase superfamily)
MTALHDYDTWSPQGPVEELSDESCWELLRQESFGRLAVSINDQPQIFPVDYYAADNDILFRTAAGTKLHDIGLNNTVAFEIDSRNRSESWSVGINGVARILTDDSEIAIADRAPLPTWIPTAKYVYVRITPEFIRGRRFVHTLFATKAHSAW